MAITTTSVLAPQVQQEYNKNLLATPTPTYIHTIPTTKKMLSKNNGDTVRMTRYNSLGSAIVPLGNTGINPPATQLTAVNIDAKVDFYGLYVSINEQVSLTRSDPVLTAASMRLGESLRQTEDELVRNMLAATASVTNCAGGVNGDNPTEITADDISVVVQALLGADAKYFTSSIEGENKFGSAPVRNAFFALAHTAITKDLDNIAGFIDSSQYPNQGNVLPSEYGSAGHLRFLVSSIGSMTANASNLGADVYNLFCVAPEAICTVDVEGYNAQFVYNSPEIAGGPLRLNSTAGFKMSSAQAITNDQWVNNLRCTLA